MLATPEFWVAVAFFLFLALVWKVGGFTSMMKAIDGRGLRVQAELDQARRLREEAAALLADYKRRQIEVEREAEALVANARDEAQRIAQETRTRMADFVTRRTAAAEAKIAQAEAQATQQVRAAAADAAVTAASTILRDRVAGPGGADLLTKSLTEVRARLNS